MQLGTTLVFYLVIGGAVAVAAWLTDERLAAAERSLRAAGAVLFWPLFVPMLLARPAAPQPSVTTNVAEPADELAAAISQVERELDAALSSLGGWAESVLESERGRLGELRAALAAQAVRIREMDCLLAKTDPTPAIDATLPHDRRVQSEQSRSRNLKRLAELRQRTHADLLATLAWIRELVSMIHLAKFTGAPASRAAEFVAQIAAAVEGVSTVEPTWPDSTATSHASPSEILP